MITILSLTAPGWVSGPENPGQIAGFLSALPSDESREEVILLLQGKLDVAVWDSKEMKFPVEMKGSRSG